ncbi:MAG: hypothetical protein RIR11_205, partial [Bacteroidota bacterium]
MKSIITNLNIVSKLLQVSVLLLLGLAIFSVEALVSTAVAVPITLLVVLLPLIVNILYINPPCQRALPFMQRLYPAEDMRSLKVILAFLFGLMVITVSNAQCSISYPTAAQNATTCLNSSLLTVKVDVITAGTSPTVTIDAPSFALTAPATSDIYIHSITFAIILLVIGSLPFIVYPVLRRLLQRLQRGNDADASGNKLFIPLFSLVLGGLLCCFTTAQSQNATVSYNSTAQPTGDFTVCGSAQTNSLSISNGNAATMTNTLATLQIPSGGTYVAGSITGATESNITNLNAPVFSVPDIPASNSATITYQITFGCAVIPFQSGGGLTKETVNFTYNLGASAITDNNKTTLSTYNVVAASLSITAATNTSFTGIVGSTYAQQLTIRNGGLGCTNTAFVKLDRAGGTFSFSNPTVGTISNDTLYLATTDMPGGDGRWCNGEDVIVSYTVRVNNCTTLNRAARAGWGCGGSACQLSTAANSNVIISNAVPNLASAPLVTSATAFANYCFAGENHTHIMRITNTGTGPATNIKVRHDNANTPNIRFDNTVIWNVRNSNGVVIDSVANITAISSGLVTNHQGTGCTSLVRFNSMEGSLLNVVLAPGDYIEYEVHVTTINMSCVSCSNIGPSAGFRTDVLYQNQCANVNYTTGFQNSISRSRFVISSLQSISPDVVGGQVFNLNIQNNEFVSTNSSTGRGSIYLAIPVAGSGLSTAATSVQWGSTALPVVTRNDTIFIGPYPNNLNLSGRQFDLPLVASCGSSGIRTITSSYLAKYDSTCSPTQIINCQSVTTNVHCPQPQSCPKGGATPINFVLRRINLGGVDNDNNDIPDGSGVHNMTLIKDHRSVNGDTLMGTWNIKVNPNNDAADPNVGLPFNHLYVDFDLGGTTPGSAGSLNALPNAVATIYPAGGGAAATCTVSPTIASQKAHYDFSGCKANWVDGDSLVVTALYTVNQTNADRYNDNNSSGKTDFVTNNFVYTTYVPQATATTAPIDFTTYTCDIFNDYNTIVRIGFLISSAPTTMTGCAGGTLTSGSLFFVNDINAGNGTFPFEFRNFIIPDTIVYVLPTGFAYRPNSATHRSVAISDANVVQVGNRVYVTNIKSLYTPYGGTLVPTGELASLQGTINVDPTCDAVAGTFNWSTKPVGIGNGFNTPANAYGLGFATNNTGISTNTLTYNPALPVLAGGGTVISNTGNASWTIQLQNQANNADAANSFFYIQPLNSLSNVVIRELPSNTVISPDANGYYRLGALLRSANRNFTITADLGRCGLDSMRINFGNACSGYPTTPFTPQSCTKFTWLKASGFPASLDVTFDKIASGTVGLCTPITLETVINSTLVGNLDNEILTVELPANLNYVPGSVQVVYPVGGGYVANAYNPTISGNQLTFAVNSLTGGMGLTGVGDLTRNQVRIRFDVETVCGFTSGSSIKSTVSGTSACGDPVPSVVKTTSAINITGAAATTQYAIEAVTPTSVSTCGSNGTVRVNVINTGSINPVVNDSLTINLSNGLSYVAGSFVSLKNAPSPTAPVQMGNSLRWRIPSTVAPGDTMKFTINLAANAAGCGMNTLDLYTTQSIALPCGALSCNTPVITGRLISETITTICCVDMQVNKTVSPDPVAAGGTAVYTIAVRNAGPGTATNVVVNDVLPAGITFVSRTLTSGTWSAPDWTIPTMAAGQSDTIRITVTANNATTSAVTVCNRAFITSINNLTPEINPLNDTSQVCSVIRPNCVAVNAGLDRIICAGTATTVTGLPTTGTWTALGANPAGATLGTTAAGVASVSFTAVSNGIYRFIFTDGACADTMQFTVNEKPVIADGAVASCAGEMINLTSQIANYGTLQNHAWTLTTAAGTVVAVPTAVSPIITTTYVLVAQNAAGCRDTANVVVTVTLVPTVDAISDVIVCEGSPVSVTISGTPAMNTTYPWTATNLLTGIAASGTGNINFTSA